ncbi:MAG TPA: DUF3822 family protein [Prolixibacteraceae bacterium]|nr:DUF3822 family protein [Prolixibacteraceae bacterium]
MEIVSRYIDETFDINNCSNYILSIQCKLDGFSFAVYDISVRKFIVLSSYEFNAVTPFMLKTFLDKMFDNEPILQNVFKRVVVGYQTLKYLLAPAALVDHNQIELLQDFSFQVNRDESVIKSNLLNGYWAVTSVPKTIKAFFKDKFSDIQLLPGIVPVFKYAEKKHGPTSKMFIEFTGRTLLIVVKLEQHVEFANSFYVKNEADCLFYILNASGKIKSKPISEIVIMGNIEKDSKLIAQLKHYFEKVKLAQISDGYSVSYTFMKKDIHQYISLLELALCE